MADNVFDQIHTETQAQAPSGNVFDQIHSEQSKPEDTGLLSRFTSPTGFAHGVIAGSSILSAINHPIDAIASFTGTAGQADDAKAAKDAWDRGDKYEAAKRVVSLLTYNSPSGLGLALRAGQSALGSSKDQATKAINAFHKGDYESVVNHGGAAVLPLLAPAANGADLVKQGSEETMADPNYKDQSFGQRVSNLANNPNAREGAGMIAGNLADFAIPAAAGKVVGAVRGAAIDAGLPEALRSSAEAQYGRVLNATTKGNKMRAARVIPELIDRGITPTSLKDLAQTTAENMETASDKLQSTYEALPEEAGVPVSKIVARMKAAAADDFTVPNRSGGTSAPSSIAEKGLDNVADIASRLQDYAVPDPTTGELKIPIGTARNLRQFYDNVSKQAGRFEGGNIADQSVAAAHGSAADAIRQQIGEDFPQVAADNAEFQLWSDANRVVGDTLQRRVGQTKGLGRTMAKLGGQAAGLISHGPAGAVVGGAAMDTLQGAAASPLWNTLSANLKSKIAESIAGGRVGEISYYAKKVQDAQEQAAKNAALSAEPPPVPVPVSRQLPSAPIVTPPPADTSGPIQPTVPRGEPVVAPLSRQLEAAPPPAIVTPPPADTSGPIPGRAKALPVIDGRTGEVLYYRSDSPTPEKPYEVADEPIQSGAPEKTVSPEPAKGDTLPSNGTEVQPREGSEGTGQAVPESSGASPQDSSPTSTRVRVPGNPASYQANYQVRELKDVQPSHSGVNFQPNENYTLKNDRDYGKGENQAKVLNWSSPAEFDPTFHITDNPDATNGPAVVDTEGNVLGGNGRTMMLQRVYRYNPKGAAAYKSLLNQKAAQFGIDPESFKDMKQPVLVRELADSELDPSSTKQNQITDFNKTGTAELRPAERAIADSRRVSPDTMNHIGGLLDEAGTDATLTKVLEGKNGTGVLDRLIGDGVIAPQERAAYADGNTLTKDGQTRISKLLLGRFFRDPAQLESIAPSVRNKLERIAAPLASAEGGEWDLTPKVQEAMDLLEESKAHGMANLNDFMKQGGLFMEQKYSPESVTLAKALQSGTQAKLIDAVKQYSGDAQFAAAGPGLFGDAPKQADSFREAFTNGMERAARPVPGSVVQLKNGESVTVKKINGDGTFNY